MGKRASAGLGMPSLRELYKGSGSLLVASGPMVVVQDTSTAATVSVLDRWLPPTPALCVWSHQSVKILVSKVREYVSTLIHSRSYFSFSSWCL